MNVMIHLDRNIKALLPWHAFDLFDTFIYQFQEKKKGEKKAPNINYVAWFCGIE